MKNENKKQYKATVNLEIYFNDGEFMNCKDLCEMKLREMLKQVENSFEKEDMEVLVQSYDINEDKDDLHEWAEKIKKNEENLGYNEDIRITGEMTYLLIEALGNRFNNNFSRIDTIEANKENEAIIKIIENLMNED
jgi:cytochrome oxidase Cu insertion factor (SCO1/SenC/PrrC family)